MFGIWAALPLVTSLLLLVAFFAFRTWEERRGTRFFAGARAAADVSVSKWYEGMVTGAIPSHYRRIVVALFRQGVHMVVVLVVQGLRAIERPLMQLSYRMRRGAPMPNGKGPSEFLKTLTPEKKEKENGTTPEGGV